MAKGKKRTGPDYRTYRLSAAEMIPAALLFCGLIYAVDWLFYQSYWALLPLSPVLPLLLKEWSAYRGRERRRQLRKEFREALAAMTVTLKAGYSVDRAIPETYSQLKQVLGEEALMTREMGEMVRRLRLQTQPEALFLNLAERSGVEEIEQFADVFAAARRRGGNLTALIREASDRIGSRIETEEEIETLLMAKRTEQRIMSLMPCGIILYMRLGSPGYLDVLYHTLFGRVVMTVCLLVYAGAVLWGEAIIRIDV